MRKDAVILSIGVLVIVLIIFISDADLSGKTIYRQPEIVRYNGEDIYCNSYECEEVCGKPCMEYKNSHELPVCSHRVYYDWESEASWYMYYKCK